MAKKKSKTQKYKKNQKKKIQKELNVSVKTNTQSPTKNTKTNKEKQLVDKNKVNYNVVLNNKDKQPTKKKSEPTKKQTNTKKTSQKTNINVKKQTTKEITKIPEKQEEPKKENKLIIYLKNLKNKFKKANKKEKEFVHNNKELKKKQTQKTNKNIKKSIPKTKQEQDLKKKNIFIRLLYEIKNNVHIFFNTILIVTFIVTLIGLIRINVFQTGTIIYMCAIALFLMTVAISYNKYMSGKVFSIILTVAMGFVIYEMQYTYDFIRNLNSNVYEYKTYYVVTFNTSSNRSIYNINNKKVGLLDENCINIERKLNTKLDKVNYIEYDNVNDLFGAFFDQEFRAIIVNENQYKYLVNKIEEGSRDVKILYEFEVNAKK